MTLLTCFIAQIESSEDESVGDAIPFKPVNNGNTADESEEEEEDEDVFVP